MRKGEWKGEEIQALMDGSVDCKSTPGVAFDLSPESNLGGGRQGQCSVLGGKNQTINPPNYMKGFAEGSNAVQGQELGKSRNPSKPAHWGSY